MKAAVLYGNRDIRFEEYTLPEVTKKSVKIRVRAAGICGSDVPRVLNDGAHFYPIVLGHEFSGDVVEIGEEVTNVSVGDTAAGVPLMPCMKCIDCIKGNYSLCKHYSFIGSRQQGGFAEYVVLPAENVIKYDPSVSYEQAAMFEPSSIALHGIRCNSYKGGKTAAILGCGTIGLFTIQWAKIFGAKKIVAFDIDDKKLELAKEMGADETVNTSDKNYMDKALAFTDNVGYEYIFETAGSVPTIFMSLELAANKANICYIGLIHNDMTITSRLWELINRKELKLTGSWMGYSSPFPGEEWELTAHCFSNGQLKYNPKMIYKKFPLSEANDAFLLFDTPENIQGKIMLINE